jgi:hypothetical protein
MRGSEIDQATPQEPWRRRAYNCPPKLAHSEARIVSSQTAALLVGYCFPSGNSKDPAGIKPRARRAALLTKSKRPIHKSSR